MIQVERRNYNNGEYRCRYYFLGREIANYSSSSDTIFLRTEFIGCDFSKSAYERALDCKLAEAYKYLFAMLGIDETSSVSDYMFA